MINNGREELRNWNYWRERRARPETVRGKKKKEVMAKGTILGDEENKLFPCGQPTEIEHGERHWRDKRFIQRLCLYSLFHMYLETVPSFREPIGKIVSELFLSLLVCFDCSHLIVMTI